MTEYARPVPIECVAVQVRSTDGRGIVEELRRAAVDGHAVVLDDGQCRAVAEMVRSLTDSVFQFRREEDV